MRPKRPIDRGEIIRPERNRIRSIIQDNCHHQHIQPVCPLRQPFSTHQHLPPLRHRHLASISAPFGHILSSLCGIKRNREIIITYLCDVNGIFTDIAPNISCCHPPQTVYVSLNKKTDRIAIRFEKHMEVSGFMQPCDGAMPCRPARAGSTLP